VCLSLVEANGDGRGGLALTATVPEAYAADRYMMPQPNKDGRTRET
jgi:hypothetical protein